jgi:hypothetical protein
MTDRELLELAAKAAGIGLWWDYIDGQDVCSTDGGTDWNPLLDDGDALRLAVKLGFCVTVFLNQGDVWVGYAAGNVRGNHIEPLGADHYAATRRAIVEAAAIIGATMAPA